MTHRREPHYEAGRTTEGALEPLLTIDALAELLAVDRKTVYRLPIPYVIVSARRRFRPSDVAAYLERHVAAPTESATPAGS